MKNKKDNELRANARKIISHLKKYEVFNYPIKKHGIRIIEDDKYSWLLIEKHDAKLSLDYKAHADNLSESLNETILAVPTHAKAPKAFLYFILE